jgi:hypothetical protein
MMMRLAYNVEPHSFGGLVDSSPANQAVFYLEVAGRTQKAENVN